MHFRITTDSTELLDPQETTAFHVVCPADLSRDELVAAVDRAGLGEVAPNGMHVMIHVDAVRRMAAGRVGPGWPEDFAAMLGYAARKGWTDETGDLVRAHVERD